MISVKTEQIGKVTIDYTRWPGEEAYSDGPIEQELLARLQAGEKPEEMLNQDNRYPVLYHLSPERENILSWFPLDKSMRCLEIGAGCGAVTGVLAEKCGSVCAVDLSLTRTRINAVRHQDCDNLQLLVTNVEDLPEEPAWDVVTLIGVLEYGALFTDDADPFRHMLRHLRAMLKPGGHLLIAIENQFGLKYFSGAREDHHWKLYEGLLGYPNGGAQTFSRQELDGLLGDVGFSSRQFFGVWPDYKFPEILRAENAKNVSTVYPPANNRGEYVYAISHMENIMHHLTEAGLGIELANSFFVCAGEEPVTTTCYAKFSSRRSADFAIQTLLFANGTVRKEPLRKAQKAIPALMQGAALLSASLQGAEVICPQADGNAAILPLLEGHTLSSVYHHSDASRRKAFLERYQTVLNSLSCGRCRPEDHSAFTDVFGDIKAGECLCLQPAPIDLSWSNIMVQDEKWTVFDTEWVFDFPVPARYVLWRTLFLYGESVGENVSDLIREMISEEEVALFRKMELGFQRYFAGDRAPFHYNSRYELPSVDAEELAETVSRLQQENKNIQALADSLAAQNQEAWTQFAAREKQLDVLRREMNQIHDQLVASNARVAQLERLIPVRILRKIGIV